MKQRIRMWSSCTCTLHHHVPWRMRKESCATAASRAARGRPRPLHRLTANPTTIEPGHSDHADLADDQCHRRHYRRNRQGGSSGSRQVTPTDSTTYHLIAKGAGGTQDATARVTVTAASAG